MSNLKFYLPINWSKSTNTRQYIYIFNPKWIIGNRTWHLGKCLQGFSKPEVTTNFLKRKWFLDLKSWYLPKYMCYFTLMRLKLVWKQTNIFFSIFWKSNIYYYEKKMIKYLVTRIRMSPVCDTVFCLLVFGGRFRRCDLPEGSH